MTQLKAMSIRAKKLGVLIRDARMATGKTRSECAKALNISSSTMGSYERGVKSPSLPELEMLAYYLDVPLEHFWGQKALSENGGQPQKNENFERLLSIRQRIIGTMLRKARLESGLSLTEFSTRVGWPSRRLSKYELGERAIPLPELEVLVAALGRSIHEFFDLHGPVGAWINEQNHIQQFLDLPPELQNFVCKPVNLLYLDVALRLSKMSVEQLRSVAEGLLEITL